MENLFDIEADSICVECGKKIKSCHFYAGVGPYGICCYKKLFGTVGLIVRRVVKTKVKIPKNNTNCNITGNIKDCDNCLLVEYCEFK
jgi:hypothetical protein